MSMDLDADYLGFGPNNHVLLEFYTKRTRKLALLSFSLINSSCGKYEQLWEIQTPERITCCAKFLTSFGNIIIDCPVIIHETYVIYNSWTYKWKYTGNSMALEGASDDKLVYRLASRPMKYALYVYTMNHTLLHNLTRPGGRPWGWRSIAAVFPTINCTMVIGSAGSIYIFDSKGNHLQHTRLPVKPYQGRHCCALSTSLFFVMEHTTRARSPRLHVFHTHNWQYVTQISHEDLGITEPKTQWLTGVYYGRGDILHVLVRDVMKARDDVTMAAYKVNA